jgi:hypothetical protein
MKHDFNILELAKLNNILVKLYRRYMDDQATGVRVIPRVMRWNPEQKNVVFCQEQYEKDEGRKDDARTMEVMRDMSNSINPRIKLVEDFPSNHPDGKMPVLDLKVWMDENGRVAYKFFRKPMANVRTTIKVSAFPNKVKRMTHIQEGPALGNQGRSSFPADDEAPNIGLPPLVQTRGPPGGPGHV